MARKFYSFKKRVPLRRRGNPNLGKAQKKCKGKTGDDHTKCIKRESKNKK